VAIYLPNCVEAIVGIFAVLKAGGVVVATMPLLRARELTQVIYDYARHVDVLIVDSLSHFWQGEGGTLDIAAGKFTGWKDARPIQRALVDAIVQAPCHLIACLRSKVEYAQEKNEKTGKQEVTRLGQADIQDNEIPYEFTIAAELDRLHQLTITKSRCAALPLGKVYPPDREVDMAATLLAWLNNTDQSAGAEVPNFPAAPAAATTATATATATAAGNGHEKSGAGTPQEQGEGSDAGSPAPDHPAASMRDVLQELPLSSKQAADLRAAGCEGFAGVRGPEVLRLEGDDLEVAVAFLRERVTELRAEAQAS